MKTRHSDYFSPQHLRKTASLFTLTLSASYSKNMMLQSLLLGKYRKMKKQTKLPSSTIYNLQFTMMKWARSECVPDKAVMRYVILQDKLEHTEAWIHQPVSSMKSGSEISSSFINVERLKNIIHIFVNWDWFKNISHSFLTEERLKNINQFCQRLKNIQFHQWRLVQNLHPHFHQWWVTQKYYLKFCQWRVAQKYPILSM